MAISLRLLLVAPKPPPWGGIGKWTLLLTAWLQGQEAVAWRVVDTAPRWRKIDDLSVIRRLFGGGIQGLRDLGLVLWVLLGFRPHVMHLTTSGGLAGLRDVVLLSLARLLRVRSVYHIHMGRLPEIVTQSGGEWRLLAIAMRAASRVVVIDRASANALDARVRARKLALVPNAIDLAGLARMPATPLSGGQGRNKKRLLFVGWVIPTKGLQELMEAWRDLADPDWELVVIGPGSAAYQLKLLETVGRNPAVRFLGQLPPSQVWPWMLSAEVFVLPTYTEGFPNVILEAMAAGKAIVTTPVGAIPEMLDLETAEPCGVVVPPRDTLALVNALRQLMDDPELRAELGRRARAKVEQAYDTDIVFQQYVDLWRELACDRL